MRAQNKSPRTIDGYVEGVLLFADFAEEAGLPAQVAGITREHVEMFLGDQVTRWKPSTAATRYRSLRQFFKWLIEEGEIKTTPMVNREAAGHPRDAATDSHRLRGHEAPQCL